MTLMWIAIIGIVVGLAARLVAPGRRGPFGFLLTAFLGVMGAFGVAYLGQEAGWFMAGDAAGLVSAVFGAVLILLIWGALFRSSRPTSSI